MSQGRIELSNLISSTPIISVYYWVSLLNLFEKYQTELDSDDVKRLVAECERCRIEFNDKNTDPIRKEDTQPNVYEYLEMLDMKKQNNYNKESLLTNNLVAVAQ